MTDDEVLRWYECERKEQAFSTFAEASEHAELVERTQTGRWHAIGAYQCVHCDRYHIGRLVLRRRHGRGVRLAHARFAERKRFPENFGPKIWRDSDDSGELDPGPCSAPVEMPRSGHLGHTGQFGHTGL